MRTIADGIAVGRPGDVTYRQVEALVDEFVVVGEDALSRALLFSLERAKMLVEPAGAAPVAALLDDPGHFRPPVVAVLSGGNVDPLVLLHVIQNGMAATARYLSLVVRIGDRPGALAALLTRVGELGANVIDVEHARISATVPMGEVDVAVSLEMRGPEHCRELVAALRDAGHRVTVTGVPDGDPRLGP
jgi:threonine dehydratase